MRELSRSAVNTGKLPIKFMQFGEGNFLRAFIDWMIQKGNDEADLNMGGVIVQPLANGMIDKLKEQDCLYHVILEGIKDGQPIRETQKIDCIQDAINPYSDYQKYKEYFLLPELEFVFSNTTEAGIVKEKDEDINAEPPASFPGKVVALLHERYNKFEGAADKGLTFICCELIENNATELRRIVLELATENKLSNDFIAWINNSCSFCNSLVDRIVTGFPKDKIDAIQEELDYNDNMVVTAEYFHLWAIEGDENVKAKLPLHKNGLNVLWLDNLKPFRDKKVRVLNGAHTALMSVSMLAGCETVSEAFSNKDIELFIRNLISNEVLPNIKGEENQLIAFADEILERFFNPYIKHYLKDISLNSISKWITRDYPSLVDSLKRTGEIPQRLSFSLAALVLLYSDSQNCKFTVNDTNPHAGWIKLVWSNPLSLNEKVKKILSHEILWGVNLIQHDSLVDTINKHIKSIEDHGIIKSIQNLEQKWQEQFELIPTTM